MTFKKIIPAAAIALTLGFGAAAQAAQVDHVTADTNPAVFNMSNPMLKSSVFSRDVDHFTEATKPHVFGDYEADDVADKEQIEIELPYQRG
jgi:hypothetical protein